MVACFVSSCNNSKNRLAREKTFSRIPSTIAGLCFDVARRVDIGSREAFVAGRYKLYRICEDHFKNSDYKITNGKKTKLLPTATPYRHGPPSERRRPASALSATRFTEVVPSTSTSTELVTGGDSGILRLAQTSHLATIPAPRASTPEQPAELMQSLAIEALPATREMACQTEPLLLCAKCGSSALSMDNHSPYSDHLYSEHWAVPLLPPSVKIMRTSQAPHAARFPTAEVEEGRGEPIQRPTSMPSTSEVSTSQVKAEPLISRAESQDHDVDDQLDVSTAPDSADIDPEDMNYSANVSNMAVSSTEEEMSEDGGDPPNPNLKHIVYQSCLAELIMKLRCECGDRYMNVQYNHNKGTLLIINACCRGCSRMFRWRSQPSVGRKAKGNVELTAAIFLTGALFSDITKVFHLAEVQWMSKTLFYDYQHSHILPMIAAKVELSLEKSREVVIQRGHEIRLAGDGRYDSPGYSARYCTYTLMDSRSGLVTHSVTKETAASSSSTIAEPDAFIQCLGEAKETFSNITTLTTDGNTTIRAYMAKNEKDIRHGLDTWHINKNLTRNLAKKATRKAQKPVLEWSQHLTNHIWWATSQCERDEDMLVEMVSSMKYHVVNNHDSFYGHQLFRRCAHSEIPRDVEREIPWLAPGDQAHQVLVEYLSSPGFIKQLKQVAYGTHTSSLESFHSLILTYASKRIDFDPASYRGRVALAIMDHNENVERPLRTDPTGEPYYTLAWSKAVKGYRLRKQYVAKSYHFRHKLMADIIKHARENILDRTTKRHTGIPISRGASRPSLEEAKAAHLPRRDDASNS